MVDIASTPAALSTVSPGLGAGGVNVWLLTTWRQKCLGVRYLLDTGLPDRLDTSSVDSAEEVCETYSDHAGSLVARHEHQKLVDFVRGIWWSA